MNDAAALAIDGEAKEVLLRTKSEGHYDEGGRWVAGANVDVPIQAAVQPVTGSGLEDLPEGLRSEARLRLWTRSEVKENAVVIHKGSSYRILMVADWFDEGGYYEAVLGKLA